MPRATLRLGLACNNHCVFCAQRGLGGDAEAGPLDERLAVLRAQTDELTFTGGEPTLDASLPEAIARARAAGFARVGVQSNGRRFAQPGYADGLRRAGLTDLHVSLHGAEPAVHDYHTGVDGSFAQLWAGVAAARAAGLVVVATTVLTRSNYRVLGALPWLLKSRDVAAWLVAVPRVAGAAGPAFDRVVPRLGLALPFALHALDGARRLGLEAFIRGAPLCALGPLAARAIADEPRAFGAVCDGCAARASCPGLDPIYLARFGGDELAAREAPRADPAPAALTALFVGVGELAPAVAEVAAPSSAARVPLPLYGKVQPARREVTAAAPRKSGEALREIFPGLFDKGEA